MMCARDVVFKLFAILFLMSGSLVFYATYTMLQNTSFSIASKHLSSVHDYACKIKPEGKIYVVVADTGNVVDQQKYADIIVGKICNTTAVVSTSYSFVTSNQYFQYTGRMPFEDSYGMYFDVCVESDSNDDVSSGKLMAVCYTVLFAMFWMMVIVLMCTDCLCATVCRRGRYEEIN